ncbi:hypothetical protein [Pseudomonas sp. SDO55104_S430]
MPAMVVNDDVGSLTPSGVTTSIASKLASARDPAEAPFIQVNGAFVCKKECFSTTRGSIMRAVMIIFE